jgi:gliding motility-associated-like protein
MRRKLLVFILLLFSLAGIVKAQNTGDYQSPGTGVTVDLGSLNNWQIYNGTAWVSAASVTQTPAIPSGAASGTNITIQAPDVWANSITATTIPSGVTLTINTSAALGTFTAAKLTCLGTLVYSGTAVQTMPAATAFVSSQINNLTINNAVGVAIPTAYTIKGLIDLKAGTLTPAASGALSYGGSMQTEGGLLSLTPSNVVLYVVGSAGQVIPGNAIVNSPTTGIYKLNSLTQGGTANYSSTGPVTVTSALYLNTGTFTLGGPLDIRGGTMAFATGVTSPGSIVAGNNMITFNASSAQTVPANFFSGNTISNLNVKTISSTQGGTIFAGQLTINSSLTVASYLIPAAPTAAVNLTGTGANGVLNITGSSLTITAFSGTPVPGTPYTILSAPTITGTFSGLTLPAGYTGTLTYNTSASPQTVTLTVALSPDATLSALALSAGTLTPAFASPTTSYTATVPNTISTIAITPTANVSVANIKVNGTTAISGAASTAIPLSVGNNTITTVVTAPDGVTTKTYTVNVTRAAISTDATLSAIALSAGSLTPAFAPGTTNYTASVGATTGSINIMPTTNDSGATLTVNGTTVTSVSASAAIPLSVGNNPITIAVTAQDGVTTQTYTINVTRAALSTDAALSAIALSSGTLTPVFVAGTLSYTASVVNATSSVTLTPTTNDATATLTVNGTAVTSGSASAAIPLTVGSNTITIAVTAQHGTVNTYTIDITRPGTPQTITFNAIPGVTYGSADFAPVASSTNSTIPITYSSNNIAVATITSAGNIHIVGVGSAFITASQAGNSIYNPAAPVSQTLLVTPAILTVTANNQSKAYGAAIPTLTVSYSGFVNGDTQSILATTATASTTATAASAVNTYPITASGAAAGNNYTINYVPGTLTVTQAVRVFTFGTLPAHAYGDLDFSPTATVNTGETITYTSSDPTVATIVNGLIHIVNAGTVTITASIASNPNYANVQPISQVYTINKATQTITFGTVTVLQVGKPAFVTNASSSSGLTVTLSSADQSIASTTGLSINAVSLGSTTVTATQAGNNNYLPASLSQPVVVQDEAELVKVHTGVSPNGDGINDVLIIDGILDYPSNMLVIVNRNGSKIFQASGYDNIHHVFDGHSSINGDMLPAGTYYYELTIQTKGENKRKAGYIILKFN